jgi:hypothetical protein
VAETIETKLLKNGMLKIKNNAVRTSALSLCVRTSALSLVFALVL